MGREQDDTRLAGDSAYGSAEMLRRNMLLERELVEQGTLIDPPLAHH